MTDEGIELPVVDITSPAFVLEVSDAQLEAIARADQRLCPVWAMLKPGAPIATSYRITES